MKRIIDQRNGKESNYTTKPSSMLENSTFKQLSQFIHVWFETILHTLKIMLWVNSYFYNLCTVELLLVYTVFDLNNVLHATQRKLFLWTISLKEWAEMFAMFKNIDQMTLSPCVSHFNQLCATIN